MSMQMLWMQTVVLTPPTPAVTLCICYLRPNLSVCDTAGSFFLYCFVFFFFILYANVLFVCVLCEMLLVSPPLDFRA